MESEACTIDAEEYYWYTASAISKDSSCNKKTITILGNCRWTKTYRINILPHLNVKTEWFFTKVHSQSVTTIKTLSPEQVGVD